jgi:hypothetical protein
MIISSSLIAQLGLQARRRRVVIWIVLATTPCIIDQQGAGEGMLKVDVS